MPSEPSVIETSALSWEPDPKYDSMVPLLLLFPPPRREDEELLHKKKKKKEVQPLETSHSLMILHNFKQKEVISCLSHAVGRKKNINLSAVCALTKP